MHETPLISTIVVGLVLAFVFGALANRLRMPPLVGYLLAGVAVGPYSPGFVADQELATELSELGVILLMFGVGLNFSLKDLISVQAIAIPGALGRIVFGTLMGMGLAWLMGWSLFAGLIFGLSLSVASTVVLLKALQDRHMLDSERGRIAVGWVIVEDIAMVLALVLIPAFATLAGGQSVAPTDPFVAFVERMLHTQLGLWGVVAVTVVKLAAFVGFMLVVGRRLIPSILHFTAHTGSRELFRLAVLAIALGVAAGSAYLFGVSLALGAFFAGMILSESELSHRAAEETLPLRDAFSVLFFVAVGMLFDPSIFIRSPLPVIGVLFIVLFGKTFVAYLIMVTFRRSEGSSLSIAVSLAQVGEFSFILAALGTALGILPEEARDLILAGAIVSIVLNPVMFWAAERMRPGLEARHKVAVPEPVPVPQKKGGRIEPGVEAPPPAPVVTAAAAEEDVTPHVTALSDHTILVGFGRVGTVVGEGLLKEQRPFVLIEDAEGRVQAARAAGIEVIFENAATSRALKLANVKGAKTVVIAIPNAFEAGQATEQSRKLNPDARIIVRAHSDEEEAHLRHLGADAVIMGEREIGLGMMELLDRGAGTADEPKASRLPPIANVLLEAAVAPQPDPPSRPQLRMRMARVQPPLPVLAPVPEGGFSARLEPLLSEPVVAAEPEPVVTEPTAPEIVAVTEAAQPLEREVADSAPLIAASEIVELVADEAITEAVALEAEPVVVEEAATSEEPATPAGNVIRMPGLGPVHEALAAVQLHEDELPEDAAFDIDAELEAAMRFEAQPPAVTTDQFPDSPGPTLEERVLAAASDPTGPAPEVPVPLREPAEPPPPAETPVPAPEPPAEPPSPPEAPVVPEPTEPPTPVEVPAKAVVAEPVIPVQLRRPLPGRDGR